MMVKIKFIEILLKLVGVGVVVLSCEELKMLVQYQTILHVSPYIICTFAMYLESVNLFLHMTCILKLFY